MSLGIGDFVEEPSHLDLKVMNVEYTDSSRGTVVHVFGRDSGGGWHHVEVEGHRPSFFIREEAYSHRVDNHYAVHDTERHDPETGERYTDLHGDPLVRVYTHQPSAVGEMRDLFDETWEADVLYDKRWLIDSGVHTGIRVDTTEAVRDEPWLRGEMRVEQKAVEPLSRDATPGVEPVKVVVDIEVAGEEGVPDTDTAKYPVSTIVAWDSVSEQYVGWLLKHEDHPPGVGDGATLGMRLRRFDDESEMLHDFNTWLAEKRPDIITGWYSNDFDIPYLVQRCRNLNTYNYQDWSPLGDVFISKYEPVVSGVSCVDMLAAYEKTKYRELQSKKLEDVGQEEVGEGKVEHELSHTEMWKQKPVEFLRYNRKDVELVHRIDDAVGATDLLDNLRAVVGCSYTDPIGGNIDMMDVLFLRKAREYGIALPTAEEPEVGYYHGAYVYTPQAGLHEHVVYPDYSSLYPNIMYQCNISPETVVGTMEDLEKSEYTEEDCVWSYIDTTNTPAQKEEVEADEADMERIFFLKPSVEEGFVRRVLDDVMELADQYTGSMYESVKRVRNSTYGVMGDSDSYGRGFRLFDWRLAEAITLGGQRVLKEGGRVFTEMVEDPDAEVIYGDTDSVVTKFPNAESSEDALGQAMDAAEEINDYLNEYAADEFGLESVDEARMDLEIESYARGIFFKGRNDGRSDDGVKKRYAQLIEWDDKDGWHDEPELQIKGFEYVRSDIAQVTQDVQYEVFEALLTKGEEEAREYIEEHVTGVITAIMEDDYDLNDVGKPFGIGQSLDEYGSPDRTPQPQYRGSKYANEFLYGGESIVPGDKPLMWYIEEGKTGPLRSTYRATTREDGRYVDAISAHQWEDVPEGVRVDREKMVQKTIISALEDIFQTLGWGTSWMEKAVEDAKPPEAYRDEGQRGFEDFGETSAADFM